MLRTIRSNSVMKSVRPPKPTLMYWKFWPLSTIRKWVWLGSSGGLENFLISRLEL